MGISEIPQHFHTEGKSDTALQKFLKHTLSVPHPHIPCLVCTSSLLPLSGEYNLYISTTNIHPVPHLYSQYPKSTKYLRPMSSQYPVSTAHVQSVPHFASSCQNRTHIYSPCPVSNIYLQPSTSFLLPMSSLDPISSPQLISRQYPISKVHI